jgi:hypothetical protein
MRMSVQRKNVESAKLPRIVDFRFNDKDYKIDLLSERVYRNWVSVEAARSITILSAYRHAVPLSP